MKNDGENLVVAFRTSSKNKDELIVLNIKAYYSSTLTPAPTPLLIKPDIFNYPAPLAKEATVFIEQPYPVS